MRARRIVLAAALAALAGCETSVRRTQPPEIRTITLAEFRNDTPEPLLVPALSEELRRAFRLDGRLAVDDGGTGADAALTGALISYERYAARYDANNVVQEYRLRLVVELGLTGASSGTPIEAGPRRLEHSVSHVVVPASGLPVETESDAQRRLLRELAREAVLRVLESR